MYTSRFEFHGDAAAALTTRDALAAMAKTRSIAVAGKNLGSAPQECTDIKQPLLRGGDDNDAGLHVRKPLYARLLHSVTQWVHGSNSEPDWRAEAEELLRERPSHRFAFAARARDCDAT